LRCQVEYPIRSYLLNSISYAQVVPHVCFIEGNSIFDLPDITLVRTPPHDSKHLYIALNKQILRQVRSDKSSYSGNQYFHHFPFTLSCLHFLLKILDCLTDTILENYLWLPV